MVSSREYFFLGLLLYSVPIFSEHSVLEDKLDFAFEGPLNLKLDSIFDVFNLTE